MEHQDAVNLIAGGVDHNSESKVWADLGCGPGTFTLALASLLSAKSHIFAIDRNPNDLEPIPDNYEGTAIEKICLDFQEDHYPSDIIDGFLMANSLHYVKNKSEFLEGLEAKIAPNGSLVLVEYETRYSNPWIPYPVNRTQLLHLLEEAGFIDIKELAQMDSRYGHLIYSVGCKNG